MLFCFAYSLINIVYFLKFKNNSSPSSSPKFGAPANVTIAFSNFKVLSDEYNLWAAVVLAMILVEQSNHLLGLVLEPDSNSTFMLTVCILTLLWIVLHKPFWKPTADLLPFPLQKKSARLMDEHFPFWKPCWKLIILLFVSGCSSVLPFHRNSIIFPATNVKVFSLLFSCTYSALLEYGYYNIYLPILCHSRVFQQFIKYVNNDFAISLLNSFKWVGKSNWAKSFIYFANEYCI